MLPFPMRSAPILARYPQRRSDLQMRPLHPECIYRTFRRSDIASPFLPITSLQPLHFHAIAHSFAQRRQAMCCKISSLRTLLPLTADIFSPTHYFRSVLFLSSIQPQTSSSQRLAASWASPKKSSPLQSGKSSLFLQNTRVGVSSSLKHSASSLKKCYLFHS